ncbi:MAG: hypothetical protein JXB18_12555 [Sedimentisphaerales bacterium]|nr:hypothetical protein [Sedimentisphaerales bacterium]
MMSKGIQFVSAWFLAFVLLSHPVCFAAESKSQTVNSQGKPLNISGIYPHLTMWNMEGECGTGAVVPWQNSLWVITYAPHSPGGSSDKLYEITADLHQNIFSGSVGGTPANRMIHNESGQLIIGPYLIDKQKNIRVIGPNKMFGRLTANARHLTDLENKIYYATMEEGLYEADVNTLEVNCLIRDGNNGAPESGIVSKLPGYHGKGMYSGQGRIVYANNGERHTKVTTDPTLTSGALAQWFGQGDWQLVRRNQFTEVTGPNGIYGSRKPQTDLIWSMGWDARSLILALLDNNEWHYYRLPKGSHSYDGSHGWNTEWPRIREIGEQDLLATMHGTFWRFPATFSRKHSAGIAPRSNYLKVIGDFCRWNDQVVFGCDDSAKSEFYNKRSFKSEYGGPKESNSNLWFVHPERIDQLGPAIGRGSVWLRDDVKAGVASEPYLFSGYDYRQLNLSHKTQKAVTFMLEIDRNGTDEWTPLGTITIPAKGAVNRIFNNNDSGTWIRLKADKDAVGVTAHFHYRNKDNRSSVTDKIYAGVAATEKPAASGGLMRSLSHSKLGLAAFDNNGKPCGYYELNQQMQLIPIEDAAAMEDLIEAVRPPQNVYQEDAASILIVEDEKRYRLPKYTEAQMSLGTPRICREVATERDLLSVNGTFYELPARNAQGLAKIRPIASHNLVIHDFCSHMGLLLFTGIDKNIKSSHIFRSNDGKAAVWAGVVDDLWLLGKPRGTGGPWKDTEIKAHQPSDPYLMTGYDKKKVTLTSSMAATITLEVDVDGTELWVPYHAFNLEAGKTVEETFPDGFSAYWIRAISDSDTTATVILTYE